MTTTTSTRIVLRGGHVIDQRADVLIEDGRISQVGAIPPLVGERMIDCTGRIILPGFVDAHSHADGLLGDESVQRALLRQGVTTVITAQDGVSYAPGDGRYASEYFGAINGPYEGYHGGGIASYLSSLQGTTRLNAATLVPAGTVRWEVCGRSDAPATPEQVRQMTQLVEEGVREGAVGLSTGLDYVPGMFQDAAEIAALSVPVARAGGVYVTHMRGGYERNTAAGIDEIAEIADRVRADAGAELAVHVSHFHAEADIVLAQLDALSARGVDASFDAYPYIRGCTLLSMPLLPPSLSVQPADDVVAVLSDPAERRRLRREWFPRVERNASLGPDWPGMITLAHVPAPEYAWTQGKTIDEAARQVKADPIDIALDILRATRLQTNVVMAVSHPRPDEELARIFAHPAHMGGSDGIFIGAHPHPRARGTFARYLRTFVREQGTWNWADAVSHLSLGPAQRFGLGQRGTITPGAVADIIVVDPAAVADRATYDNPHAEAVGIDDVLVAGVPVLAGGELTAPHPGRGIRFGDPR